MNPHGTAVRPDAATEAAPKAEASTWRRLAAAWFPPLVAVLAGWSLLAYRSGVARDALLAPATWARWDSFQYLSIAERGYRASFCPRGYVPSDPTRADFLCGNAGWFPGYPLLIRGLSELAGISLAAAALLIAWACWYAVLVLLWQLLADARSRRARWVCLLVAAFFPGQVYLAALFPVSLCLAAMLGCLLAALRGSRRALAAVAALCGFAAAASYLTALVLAPALLLTAVLVLTGRQRVRNLAGAAGVVVGFGAVLLGMQLSVGMWDAYFRTAEKYQVGLTFPWETLWARISPLWAPQPGRGEFWRTAAEQTVLALSCVLVATVLTLVRAARGPAAQPSGAGAPDRPWWSAAAHRVGALDLGLLLAAVGVWLVPYLAGGQASTYRSEAFVILTVPLLRRLPTWLLLVLLAAAVTVAWRMAPLFFSGALV